MTNQRAVANREPNLLTTDIVLDRYGYTPRQKEVLARQIGPGLSDDQILYGLEVAKARGLDVLRREVYLADIKGRVAIIPSIEGLRAICERSRLMDGPIDIEYCGADGVWTDAWLSESPPAAARAIGYRKDSDRPYKFVALWREFHGAAETWTKYGIHMLGIVAERHLRKRMVPELLQDLDIEESSAEELEASAVRRLWKVAADHGAGHKQVHAMFGIEPGDSLREEIERRGMDWRDAAAFVSSRLAAEPVHARIAAPRENADSGRVEPIPAPSSIDAVVSAAEERNCAHCGRLCVELHEIDGIEVCGDCHAEAIARVRSAAIVEAPAAILDGSVRRFIEDACLLLPYSRDEIRERLRALGTLQWGNTVAPEEIARRWEAIQR